MRYTIDDLVPIFRDVLEDDGITLTETTVAADVPGWDSMNHIYLVVAIEKRFKVKFTTYQIQNWKCVGDMLADLNK
jgi:acyl carrier protein